VYVIELGDIITQVNQQVIDVEADLFQALEDLQPGDVVEVQVSRLVAMNDELQMKQITLYIKLQPSSQMERNFSMNSMPQQPYRYPLPSR
jgi:S1-C subfamily serine protease